MRRIMDWAGWVANYEFEDVVTQVDDADLLEITPGTGFRQAEWIVQRLLWRPGVRHIARHLNPGLSPITLDRDYEVFFYVCMNPFELLYLNGIRGWRERSKRRVCYLVEAYAGWTREWAFHLGLLRDFDHVCVGLQGSVAPLQELLGKPCSYVPFAVDAIKFSPLPHLPQRSIDVYSLGRRVETTHQELLRKSRADEVYYVYDTLPAKLLKPTDYRQHRDLIANTAKRSRFFIAYPAKVDNPGETRGQSEAGNRYYEGVAAGTLLIGATPTGASFRDEFGWPDATIDLDREGVLDHWLTLARQNPARLDAMAMRNAREGLLRHDWLYRWQQVLKVAGLEPTEKFRGREARLLELAERARVEGDRFAAAAGA
jgi:hypothetical protein